METTEQFADGDYLWDFQRGVPSRASVNGVNPFETLTEKPKKDAEAFQLEKKRWFLRALKNEPEIWSSPTRVKSLPEKWISVAKNANLRTAAGTCNVQEAKKLYQEIRREIKKRVDKAIKAGDLSQEKLDQLGWMTVGNDLQSVYRYELWEDATFLTEKVIEKIFPKSRLTESYDRQVPLNRTNLERGCAKRQINSGIYGPWEDMEGSYGSVAGPWSAFSAPEVQLLPRIPKRVTVPIAPGAGNPYQSETFHVTSMAENLQASSAWTPNGFNQAMHEDEQYDNSTCPDRDMEEAEAESQFNHGVDRYSYYITLKEDPDINEVAAAAGARPVNMSFQNPECPMPGRESGVQFSGFPIEEYGRRCAQFWNLQGTINGLSGELLREYSRKFTYFSSLVNSYALDDGLTIDAIKAKLDKIKTRLNSK